MGTSEICDESDEQEKRVKFTSGRKANEGK